MVPLFTVPLPPLLIVLQPNPVPEVQVRAFAAPEQLGTASGEGVVAVSAPRTVLAACVARAESGMSVNPTPLPLNDVLLSAPVVKL